MKLNALFVKNVTEPGRYADGNDLYLMVRGPKSKSWIFRYSLDGRRKDMGLGSAATITLVRARQLAYEYRLKIEGGQDPLAVRKADEAARKVGTKTFGDCLEEYVKANTAAWTNSRQERDVRAGFRIHAPWILDLPVKEVTVETVTKVLDPIWPEITESATRIRARIEAILNLARVRGYRTGENPAMWKGNLEYVYKPREHVKPTIHHRAMPFVDVSGFYQGVLKRETAQSAMALRLIILTAVRTSEALHATWGEIKFDDAIWVIPAERMKMSREHRIPLSRQALEILRAQRAVAQNDWVFPGRKYGKPVNPLTCSMLMIGLGRSETVHGFRSTFKDWASERTDFPNEVSEMALAHAVKNRVESAYRRGDLFEKRKILMQSWADFCDPS